MGNDLVALREIRPDPKNFQLPVANRLRKIITGLSSLYLSSANHTLHLRFTETLLLYLDNLDSKLVNSTIFFSLGNENSPTGATKAVLSEKYLLSLNDIEKNRYLLLLLHQTLTSFARATHHTIDNILEAAYEKCLSGDFYYNSYNPILSNDKKTLFQIQSRENWDSADHRLLVKNTSTNEFKTYHILRTTHQFFDEMPNVTQESMWDVILNTPQTFNPIKLDRKNLVMYWGKEKYVFYPEQNNIIKEA